MDKHQYWNIVKGLGIIAVVLGHTGSPVTPYIYMYHLALFFFVAGFLYKDQHSADPFGYFANRLRRLWWPMVQYGIMYVLLHNVFLQFYIYSEEIGPGILPAKYFSGLDFFNSVKGTLFMQGLEPMAGAMWFLYPLLVGSTLFCSIRSLAGKFTGYKRETLVSVLVVLLYAAGVTLIKNRIGIEYHADTGMLIVPLIYAGFLTQKIWTKIPLTWYGGCAALAVVVVIYKITGTHVELSQKQIIGPKWFLAVSLAGIYFNLVLAKVVQNIGKLREAIAYLGEKSFHIMALHFLLFKVVSWLYVFIYGKPYFWIAKFPIITPDWWLLYSIVGLGGSVVCVEVYKKLLLSFMRKFNKFFDISTA